MTRTIYVYENPENGEIIESPCEINGWTPVRTYDIEYPDPGSGGGGGGGGTTDYNALLNKPQINGHALSGNKTAAQLGLVAAVAGKGLSTNDFTTEERQKLEGLSNYDDTTLIQEIANRYTKEQTDAKIAEVMTDVDNEHFHPVTVLPDPADADPTKRPKENHEYVVIEYEQDGTTIKSETHYLFYGGAYHQKSTGGISLDGYATEDFVNTKTAKMGEFDVTPIPQGPTGANEINAVLSNKDNENARVSYVRQSDGTLPNTVNLGVKSWLGEDSFQLATVGYVDSTDKFLFVPTDQDDWQDVPAQGEGVKGVELTTPYTYEELVASGKQIAVKIDSTSENADSQLCILQHHDNSASNRQFYGYSTYVDWVEGVEHYFIDTVQIVKQPQTDKTWLYRRTSEISGGTIDAYTKAETDGLLANKQDKSVYVVDRPEGTSPVSGSVVQVGSFVNTDGTEYGIYEFYYKTSALPAADATKTYSFSPLLDDYTIFDFIDQSGITSNGHVISSGRTDGTNRIIIQQFSKNNKNVMLRAYGDYTAQTALLRIKFIGTKNNA